MGFILFVAVVDDVFCLLSFLFRFEFFFFFFFLFPKRYWW